MSRHTKHHERQTHLARSPRHSASHPAPRRRGAMSRRAWLAVAAGGAAVLLAGAGALLTSARPAHAAEIAVYKSPTCVCCERWLDHLRRAGFRVTEHGVTDVAPVKQKYGVPNALASCHTALAGGYVIEGHVPAGLVERLLAEQPAVVGIAVPGMPAGSPGMESSGGQERYEVLAFSRSGETTTYDAR